MRDAEVERTLARIANPVFRAAGLNPASVHVYIVNDRELNAFVAGGQNIFLFTGLLARLETIDQLRAVIAHETGHITGGHQARRDQAMKGARGMALIGMIGAAAATAGGSPTAGLAIASSSRQAAERSMLAHNRAEEASADQAGIRYMAAAGSDPAAMLEVLDLFRGQEALMPSRMDPYALTHPLWSERIALLEQKTAALPHGDGPSPEDVYWHDRMVAKITGFLGRPSEVARRYPAGDGSEAATLARAIAAHRRPDPARAAALADTLIAARPEDAYYHELKGQFLLESGQAGGAVAAYREAVALAPDEPLILAGLGRALLNLEDGAADAEARAVLTRSAALDKANAGVYRDLALAEARLGDEGAASLATAERFVLEGRFADAERHAARAAGLLPAGSPGWLQAQDVITVARRAQK
ncbi:MAG: M48 family metalloprotease [Rhodobacteraceae bacterium]|nr:M48 family metalloprotease [Paracoccaceae bacterium]